MGHQRWLAAVLAPALALAWLLQPAQARVPMPAVQAAQAARDTQAAQADARAVARRQTEQTDQANRDAAVPDEASSAATGAQPARAGANARAADEDAGTSGTQAAQSYGPVLYVNGKPVLGTTRRDPAEVHDEADTGANPATPATPAAIPAAAPHSQQSRQPQQQQQQQQRGKQAAPRHPAWQAENAPMAPRPLRSEQGRASPGVTIPPPAAAPQPVVPNSNVINACQGSLCTDASGKTYNGIGNGNAGVNSNGRLCSRTGVTVQCF